MKLTRVHVTNFRCIDDSNVVVATACQKGIQRNHRTAKTGCCSKSTESDPLEEVRFRLHEYVGFEELDVAASDLGPCEGVRHVGAPILGSNAKYRNDWGCTPLPKGRRRSA